MWIALTGAGQREWQMPQPLQTSATTVGLPLVATIAPATGHRSRQTEQNDPW
jgi:hypothetical protein